MRDQDPLLGRVMVPHPAKSSAAPTAPARVPAPIPARIAACIPAQVRARILTLVLAWILLLALPGCTREAPVRRAARLQGRVLVVYNGMDPASRRVADRYLRARGIGEGNLVRIEADPREEISLGEYRLRIEAPVRRVLDSGGAADSIDFIVLARGIPLRIREGGWSVDAFLGAMDLGLPPLAGRDPEIFRRLANPYFGRREPFRHSRFGSFLVTRLDGYTEEDALRLIDRSMAAEPDRGPFLLDLDPGRDGGGYGLVNESMRRAARLLSSRGLEVNLEETALFAGPERELAGYYSWGSNDGHFRPEAYRALRFRPGAIAETAVSTSARTFAHATNGQSLIADLIAGGVTGVKGYVSEPLVTALCRADILFDRYTEGFNLAESFAMASPLVQWKDVVVGDPLCSPYARGPGAPSPRR